MTNARHLPQAGLKIRIREEDAIIRLREKASDKLVGTRADFPGRVGNIILLIISDDVLPKPRQFLRALLTQRKEMGFRPILRRQKLYCFVNNVEVKRAAQSPVAAHDE